MSLLLLLRAPSGSSGYLVAYAGDAAVLYPLDFGSGVEFAGDVSEHYPLDATLVAGVEYGGDAAVHFLLTGVVPTGYDVQAVAFGGDVAAGYPVLAFVYVDGVAVPVNADLVNRIRLVHFASAADLEAGNGTELAAAFDRGWTSAVSDPGAWACSLGNEDPALAAIDYGHFIRCELDGIAAFLGVVEQMDRVAISPSEEEGEVTKLAGRSALAEWDRATIMPSTPPGSKLFSDVRRFGWMSLELLDQHWPSGRRQFRQDALADGYEAKHGTPLGWPDPEGWWIWSAPAISYAEYLPPGVLAPDDPPLHGPGVSYFRNGFVVAEDTDVAIYAACDDAFEIYIDGVPIGGNGNLNGWREAFRADVFLEAGTHIAAVKAENFDREPATNFAGLIMAFYALDEAGNDDLLLIRTGGADWERQHYPEVPPGFTAGAVIRLLLEEAQAQGYLVGWTLAFDDAADSGGNPWPPHQQFSFPVGISPLTALLQLADTHIDFRLDNATRTLSAWRYGEAGVDELSAQATLVDGLQSLVFEGRA